MLTPAKFLRHRSWARVNPVSSATLINNPIGGSATPAVTNAAVGSTRGVIFVSMPAGVGLLAFQARKPNVRRLCFEMPKHWIVSVFAVSALQRPPTWMPRMTQRHLGGGANVGGTWHSETQTSQRDLHGLRCKDVGFIRGYGSEPGPGLWSWLGPQEVPARVAWCCDHRQLQVGQADQPSVSKCGLSVEGLLHEGACCGRRRAACGREAGQGAQRTTVPAARSSDMLPVCARTRLGCRPST